MPAGIYDLTVSTRWSIVVITTLAGGRTVVIDTYGSRLQSQLQQRDAGLLFWATPQPRSLNSV